MQDNDLASYCKVTHLGAAAEGSVKQTTLYDNLAKIPSKLAYAFVFSPWHNQSEL